jgi:hypothetical protein
MLLFLYNIIFIHTDVGWSQAYLSQFVTIVYKIKTYFKNDKHLITFELLLFLYNVIFIHIEVGWSQA